VSRAHCYVTRHGAHRPAASVGLHGCTWPLRSPRFYTRAIAAVPSGRPCPVTEMGSSKRCRLGPIVACKFLQYHGAAHTSSLGSRLGSGLQLLTPTTPSAGNISKLRPLNSANPSYIVVGSGSSFPVTSVGDSVIPNHFTLTIFCWLLTLFKVFFLFITLPLIIGAILNLTPLVCL
jgi:hypothetical protein